MTGFVAVNVDVYAILLGSLIGGAMGFAVGVVSSRLWAAVLVACVWSGVVTFVLAAS